MLEGGKHSFCRNNWGAKKSRYCPEAFGKVCDYELVAPAIPFYSLQTNRLAEKKTAVKWAGPKYPLCILNKHVETQITGRHCSNIL
jgi:hypothetical protein